MCRRVSGCVRRKKIKNFMWIFLSNSFLSIVKHRDLPESLLVRARVEGDITNVFPDAAVFQDRIADYRFRAIIPRAVVGQALLAAAEAIDYTNFKNSVPNPVRHDAYMEVWSVMQELQDHRP